MAVLSHERKKSSRKSQNTKLCPDAAPRRTLPTTTDLEKSRGTRTKNLEPETLAGTRMKFPLEP